MGTNFATVVAILLIAVVAALVRKYHSSSSGHLPLPPGPPRLPVIGNLLDVPAKSQWVALDAIAKVHGDVVYLELLGQPVVLLSSVDAISELLERRSAVYSSRPRFLMVMELMGFDWIFSGMPYGEKWRAHRRAFHPYFHQGAIHQWEAIQLREVRPFLRRLLAGPDEFLPHVKHLFGATVMDIVYGISVAETDDKYTVVAERVNDLLALAAQPGKYLVDTFPALKYVPAWVPGAGFQREAAQCRVLSQQMVNRPFDAVRDAVLRGDARECIATDLIQKYPDDDELSRGIAAVAYVGGSATTVSAVTSFFNAMATHPLVQQKAQSELDAIVGPNRLPDYSDRGRLPYVNAVISEVLRWHPVTPLAIPHSITTDDEYKGYRIPAGSWLIGNAWSLLHDPAVYPNPEQFNPDRFLLTNEDGTFSPNTQVRDPRTAAFGFGRRICPGRHLADQSLFLVVASVLAAFSVSPATGADGLPVPVDTGMTDGLVSHPVPFRCAIEPRSANAETLVRASGASVDA